MVNKIIEFIKSFFVETKVKMEEHKIQKLRKAGAVTGYSTLMKFRLNHYTKSATADRLKINNHILSPVIVNNLRRVHENIIRPLLYELKEHPEKKNLKLTINSGYRCFELNKAVGGSKYSQHVKGQAVDIEVKGLSNLNLWHFIHSLHLIKGLQYDQLILEFHNEKKPESGWVHVSYNHENNRLQKFRIGGSKT